MKPLIFQNCFTEIMKLIDNNQWVAITAHSCGFFYMFHGRLFLAMRPLRRRRFRLMLLMRSFCCHEVSRR
jgi:hypothetical protein